MKAQDYNCKWTTENSKKTISFYDNKKVYHIKENDVITFKFYGRHHQLEDETCKGKVVGFGWGHDSPPYYIIVNRWRDNTSEWGSGRYSIKIPGCNTGRALSGELVNEPNQ
jgi:hypothetical protein